MTKVGGNPIFGLVFLCQVVFWGPQKSQAAFPPTPRLHRDRGEVVLVVVESRDAFNNTNCFILSFAIEFTRYTYRINIYT